MAQPSPSGFPAARLAGALYLTIIIAALFAEVFVRDRLIVSGDAAATAQRIMGSELLYRAGSMIDLLVLFCDISLALLLYVLLKPVSNSLALLAAFFRLIFAAIAAVDGVLYFAPLILLHGGAFLNSFSVGQLQTLAMAALKLQSAGYNVALVFFGVHCVLIGVLIARSVLIPRVIGVLMAIAGTCYIVNSFNHFLPFGLSAPLYPYILLPGLVGEGALTLWLLIAGISPQRWDRQASLSADQA